MNYSVAKSISVLFLISLLTNNISAQEIPKIKQSELSDLTITRNETFDGESLWGYMNGGADIYLEYGFEILRVEEFVFQDEEVKMELFKMKNSLSAFGIYSIKTFKCEQSNVLAETDCLNKFQHQALCGNYYIQIINNSGSEEAKELMKKIAEKIIMKIDINAPVLPCNYLLDTLGVPFSDIKMVKGYLGLQNKLIELSAYFDGLTDYQVYFAKVEEEGEKVNYYEVVFGDKDKKQRFKDNIQGKLPSAIFQSDNLIVFKTMH